MRPVDQFPYLNALSQQVIHGTHHGVHAFEFELELILAGLEKVRIETPTNEPQSLTMRVEVVFCVLVTLASAQRDRRNHPTPRLDTLRGHPRSVQDASARWQ